MPHWECTLDQVQPWQGIDSPIDVRLSDTYRNRENYTLDFVGVPGRNGGWTPVGVNHPLRHHALDGLEPILNSPATEEAIDAAIREAMNDGMPRRCARCHLDTPARRDRIDALAPAPAFTE